MNTNTLENMIVEWAERASESARRVMAVSDVSDSVHPLVGALARLVVLTPVLTENLATIDIALMDDAELQAEISIALINHLLDENAKLANRVDLLTIENRVDLLTIENRNLFELAFGER